MAAAAAAAATEATAARGNPWIGEIERTEAARVFIGWERERCGIGTDGPRDRLGFN
jgi:hypothetical protein